MGHYYELDENRNAVPCTQQECFYQREEMNNNNTKQVARDEAKGKIISTVWLGINHNPDLKGKPLIFETLVFEEENNVIEIYAQYYSTWTEAKEGHQETVRLMETE